MLIRPRVLITLFFAAATFNLQMDELTATSETRENGFNVYQHTPVFQSVDAEPFFRVAPEVDKALPIASSLSMFALGLMAMTPRRKPQAPKPA